MSTSKNQTKRVADESSVPKTRFTAHNKSSEFRSVSSPRLKSFPAEEIRRIARSPRQQNTGQGDSLPQSFPPLTLQHENQTMDQQYFSQAAANTQKYSEVLLSSNGQRPLDSQIHRPFVPNTHRNPSVRQSAEALNRPTGVGNQDSEIPSHSDYLKDVPDNSDCEKQPVGGRSAANHRQIHLAQKNQPQTIPQQSFSPANQGQCNPFVQTSAQSNDQLTPGQPYYDTNNYHKHPLAHTQHPSAQQMPQTDMQQQPHLNHFNAQNQHSYYRPVKQQPRYRNQATQQQYHEYPPLKSHHKQEEKKKHPIPFTPAMRRDQELLIATMRQQGIAEEIMERQFDTLLNEQKRQLMYRHQLEQEGEVMEAVQTDPVRKISRYEDGKPEWMMHITPPWIPYALVEEMKNSQRMSKERIVKMQEARQGNTHKNAVNTPQYNNLPQQIGDNPHQHMHYRQETCNDPQSYPGLQQAHLMQPNNYLASYHHDVKRHRQNNGLQDMAAVKEAIEDLKNGENRPGLEYLANLTQRERMIALNGVQDPDDVLMKNLPYRPNGVTTSEVKKGPSANGLENQRNHNNPLPTPIIHHNHFKEERHEYPRRKVNFAQNHSYLPAERDNEAMGNSMIVDYQQYPPAFQNSGVFGDTCENPFQAQVSMQAQGGTAVMSANHEVPYNFMRSDSSPHDNAHQQAGMNGFYPKQQHNAAFNSVIEQQHPNLSSHAVRVGPEQVCQPKIIGGVKYFARHGYD